MTVTDTTQAAPPANELSDDEVRKLLDWCREHAAEPDALTTLNDMGPTLLRASVGKDAMAVVHAILDVLAKDSAPNAHIHAHMMILLATLLDHRTQRDAVDGILLRWMRHPASFGPARATPPELQKEGFVQRVADALGWGSLSIDGDKDAIARLLAWVDTWAPKQKAAAARIVAMMRRNFPQGAELWKLVRVEFNRDKHHPHERRGRDGRDRGRGAKPKAEPTSAEAVVSEEAAASDGKTPGDDAASATAPDSATAASAAEGVKKKRRRRRRKRKPGDANVDAANASADGSEGDDGADAEDDEREGEAASSEAAPEASAASAASESATDAAR
jgi:hypothetical protein